MMMVLQAFIVVGLLSAVLLIGYNQQKDARNMDRNIKLAARVYVADKKLKPTFNNPIIIFKDDLEGKYLKSEVFEDYCIEDVMVSKGLFRVEYEIHKCETE